MSLGIFLGLFLSVFETFMRLVRLYDLGTKSQRAFFGGMLAGASLFIIPNTELRVSIAVFFLMRAFEVMTKYAIVKKMIPYVPFSEIILMSISSCQVLWAMLYERNSLEPGYRRFLDYQGGAPMTAYPVFQDKCSPQSPNLAAFNQEIALKNIAPITNPSACDLWHPGQSCVNAVSSNVVSAFKKAIPLYTPVYLLPMVIFKSIKMIQALSNAYLVTF